MDFDKNQRGFSTKSMWILYKINVDSDRINVDIDKINVDFILNQRGFWQNQCGFWQNQRGFWQNQRRFPPALNQFGINLISIWNQCHINLKINVDINLESMYISIWNQRWYQRWSNQREFFRPGILKIWAVWWFYLQVLLAGRGTCTVVPRIHSVTFGKKENLTS